MGIAASTLAAYALKSSTTTITPAPAPETPTVEKPTQTKQTISVRLPRLHLAQKEIKSQARRFNVVNCGRRFGKDILSIDLLTKVVLEGYPVAWFQPTYKSLLEVWRTVKLVLKPVTIRASEQDKRIELITGGVIEFWSLDSDPEACRGRKYKRVVINEAAKCKYLKRAWEMAVRPTLTDYKGDAYFPSTPRGRDFYWELFQRGQPNTAEARPSWKSWQMPTSRNPKIDPDEIAEAKADLPATTFAQEYEAEFLDVAGRFFDEWEPERITTEYNPKTGEFYEVRAPWHVCDAFNIPDWWNVWGSVDYGTSVDHATFCFLLYTIDTYGTIIVIDEVIKAGTLAPAQAVDILECLERNGLAECPNGIDREHGVWKVSPRFGICPMDWANTFPPEATEERLGKYPVEHYWERGLNAVVPAVKSRRAGWGEVKRLMHATRKITRNDGSEDVAPMFKVFKGRCSYLIRTIPQMIRSEKDPEDIEGGNARGGEKKQDDHGVDTLRMGVMTRPEPSVEPVKKSRWQLEIEGSERKPKF